MKPIEIIKEAAKKCEAPELSQIVYLDSDIALYDLADKNQHTKCFIDVPAKSVVALGRSDFWDINSTWKEVLEKIHGTGWTEEIFEYFRSDLLENRFPAPSSLYELRLNCVGGACEVGNGNHRLVAGKNWLISQQGSNAVFLKVKVSYYSLNHEIKRLLTDSINKNIMVRISQKSLEPTFECYFHLHSRKKHKLMVWDGVKLVAVREHGGLKSFIFWLFNTTPDFNMNWKPLPPDVIKLLVDDEWATKQLESK